MTFIGNESQNSHIKPYCRMLYKFSIYSPCNCIALKCYLAGCNCYQLRCSVCGWLSSVLAVYVDHGIASLIATRYPPTPCYITNVPGLRILYQNVSRFTLAPCHAAIFILLRLQLELDNEVWLMS